MAMEVDQAETDGLHAGDGCVSGSFSPMRRATMAVVDRLRPMPTAKTRPIATR